MLGGGRGGRVVEGSGLENRQGCEPLEGSNPSLSANGTLLGAFRGADTQSAGYPPRPGEVAEWLKALPC